MHCMVKKFPKNHPRPTTLRLIRKAEFGDDRQSTRRMAELLQISYKRWHNFEAGYRMPEEMEDALLDALPWLGRRALSYIRYQDESVLSLAGLEKLGLSPIRPVSSPSGRTKRTG